MTHCRLAVVVGLPALGIALALANPGRTQPDFSPPGSLVTPTRAFQTEGTEVLARGPVHEAFAEPVDNRPGPGRVIPRQPPAPIEELPPEQKPAGDHVQWIPGYWSWDDERNDFIWVSGIWRDDPPGRQWVPGHWDQIAGGWQWSPGFWGVQGQQELAFLPAPPDPVPAAVSIPAPDNNSVFVPGSWVYHETRYLWRPGYWVAYRPGWVWVPAHYLWTPAGYLFVEGYWDLELTRRGLLFAPVYIQPVYWSRPSWIYRPQFVVGTDFLLSALFIRPGYGHYYFGDYFEPVYRRSGFVAWIDFPRDRVAFEPLFSYYRWEHRADRHWERDLRGLYAARFDGSAPRPPRTLVQQNALIQNLTVNRNANVTNVKVVAGLTPLTKVNRTVVNLQPVSAEQRLVAQKSIQGLKQVSRERSRLEAQIVATGSAPVKPAAIPRVVKLHLPKPAAAARVSEQQAPPPPVVIGRPQTRTETARPPAPPSRPENKPPRALPKAEGKPEPKPQAKAESKPPAGPPRPESGPRPRQEEKSSPPRPQAKPPGDTKKPPETKSEPKPSPRPEAKPPAGAAQPEARPEPKAAPKPEAKPPQAARPEVRPEPRLQPQREAKPAAPVRSGERRPPAPAAKPEPGERKP